MDILRSGIERGEIRPDIDYEAVMDELFAPVYHRLFFGHAQLDEDLAAPMVASSSAVSPPPNGFVPAGLCPVARPEWGGP